MLLHSCAVCKLCFASSHPAPPLNAIWIFPVSHVKGSWLLLVVKSWVVFLSPKNLMKVKKWSSQWTQFMQLSKEAWKKFRTSTGLKSWIFFFNFNFRSISLTKNLILLYISHFMNTFWWIGDNPSTLRNGWSQNWSKLQILFCKMLKNL